MTLTLTKIWLTTDQDMTNRLVKSYLKFIGFISQNRILSHFWKLLKSSYNITLDMMDQSFNEAPVFLFHITHRSINME